MDTKNEIYGRITRNLKQVTGDLNFIAVELERIGGDWKNSGEWLATERGAELDRLTVAADLIKAWDLVDKQTALLAERQKIQAQLERLDV